MKFIYLSRIFGVYASAALSFEKKEKKKEAKKLFAVTQELPHI